MTGRDLITASLRLIGALAPGESLEAQEATDGLDTLNRMIDSWSTESLLVYAKVREEFTLTANDASYTMGSGADFDTSRPQTIDRATIEVQTVTPTVEYPVNIITAEQWAAIPVKDTTSEIPTDLYPEGTYPNETLNLYPTPSTAHKLVLYSWKTLTEIATLDTSISLPPGYERALIYNFGVEVSPEYGRLVPDVIAMIARDSKAAIKRINHRPRFLRCDAALVGNGGIFDITRGDYR